MAPQHDIATTRILICEDNDSFRRALHRVLRDAGYAVTEADDGAEAVRLLTEADEPCEAFDVVIMDYNLRFGLTGGETVNMIRARCPDQPVVYLTGHELPRDLMAHEVWLLKPASLPDITAAIERALRQRADTLQPTADVPTNPLNRKPE